MRASVLIYSIYLAVRVASANCLAMPDGIFPQLTLDSPLSSSVNSTQLVYSQACTCCLSQRSGPSHSDYGFPIPTLFVPCASSSSRTVTFLNKAKSSPISIHPSSSPAPPAPPTPLDPYPQTAAPPCSTPSHTPSQTPAPHSAAPAASA